jgi:hypothetical protein
VLATPEPARATDEPRWFVEGGPGLLFSLGDVEHRDADLVTIEGFALVGLELAPRYALTRTLQIGIRGVLARELGARGTASSDGPGTESSRTHWAFGPELRWLPLDGRGLWLGIQVGAGALQETESRGGDVLATQTQWAPGGGAAVGWDFSVEGSFTVGVAARYDVYLWSDPGGLPRDGEYVYGMLPLLGFGLNVGYGW